MKHRREIHLQSADLFENFSPLQKQRQLWKPTLPDVFTLSSNLVLEPVDAPELIQLDEVQLKRLHPNIFGQPCLNIQSDSCNGNLVPLTKPYSIGIVLSGGPAPGGHNVIAGIYDYMKQAHPNSQIFGFMGGLSGVLQGKYRVITDEFMDRFRNQGGFDMLWSGRGRISGSADMVLAANVCRDLNLDGLVIVGGDGTLSNAALLSEFFAKHMPQCKVIGVPKTIDGDLQNAWVEISFGFDTAAKTYSELIGNLCTDITTNQFLYHFVRVMGRSASHLVAECAFQSRPNIVFIGEEIERNNTTLPEIINYICDTILERHSRGKKFGIILIPEGLIEFIPDIKLLNTELNKILANTDASIDGAELKSIVVQQLSSVARTAWDFLPQLIHDQLIMDREATGYIQVAKIATERLLKYLTLVELQKRQKIFNDLMIMTHYFGYEGRCAMPSNFDANYCYCLGYNAGVLIAHNKTGYVSVIRRLEQHPTVWAPGAVPITRMMEIKTNSNGVEFPAVTRKLFDLNGLLFEALSHVRESWRLDEYYRCPGPIQFEGPVANIANYSITIPKPADLLSGETERIVGFGRAIAPKRPGALSLLQKHRLQHIPEIPAICKDRFARAICGPQYLPRDPFTQRQILIHYPYSCNSNKFYLHEVLSDRTIEPGSSRLKVGIVYLSRQAPGVKNVLWGMMERLKIFGGVCIGFYGTDGLCNGNYIVVEDSDLELYLNQGGLELLGRGAVHGLLIAENRELARKTCVKLELDGLVLVGSSLAMTEAALTAEYFLATDCHTCVIGVPATGSNNLTHELIETNIGFDTASKVYASLIGNVLTDAASMPKYWHFVRLMGRQPSNEVLECALQTHPNIVIIAEEYGAANKSLGDVVKDIADVVCRRAEMGKNFGSVLIPDSLFVHLPNMKSLLSELSKIVHEATKINKLDKLLSELDRVDEVAPGNPNTWISKITPWSLALFKSLPHFIRKELTQINSGEMGFTMIETEVLLSQMVNDELKTRKKAGLFNGKFSPVSHFFGYQGRSSMPSIFDAQLAFAYGHLAVICIESGLTGHCCTIRGLCGEPKDWKLASIPFNSMLRFTGQSDEVHMELSKERDLPIIPTAEVNLNGKAYRWMRIAVTQWQLQDRFCNPGPIQFDGEASKFYHRILHEEQAEYFHMLKHVQLYTQVLRDTCSFGVDENFLKVVFANLHGLLSLRYHSEDLMTYLPPLTDVQQYELLQANMKHRRDMWHSELNELVLEDERQNEGLPLIYKRPSLIGALDALRLQSQIFKKALSKESDQLRGQNAIRKLQSEVVKSTWGNDSSAKAYVPQKQ